MPRIAECLKRLSKVIDPEDHAALLRLSVQYQQGGLSAAEADVQAVQDLLGENSSMIEDLRVQLAEQGHDVAVRSEEVPVVDDGQTTYNQAAEILGTEPKNLIVQHNLTAENLLHADKLGALPVPSLAVSNKNFPMTNFGEITLIANPSILESPKAQTFNADVYSPRYPSVVYDLESKSRSRLFTHLKGLIDKAGLKGFSVFTFEGHLGDDPVAESMLNSEDVMLAYLVDTGKAIPEMPKTENESYQQMHNRGAIRDAMRYDDVEKMKFKNWIARTLEDLQVEQVEKIFNGFTASGNRRYLPHNLDTVVKLMSKKVRDGEGFNYGVRSVRSKVAKQFKTIKSIKSNEEMLLPKEQMDVLKKEIDDEFSKLGAKAFEYAKCKDRPIGWLDTFSDHMKDVAQYGVESVAREYYSDLPAELKQEMRDFLEKLRNLPTEYFETKIRRPVQLQEFVAAVVPNSTPQNVLDVLEKHGLAVTRYTEGSREKSIARAGEKSNTLFQQDPLFQGQIRGSFTPKSETNPESLIRLFKGAANLSTFLHEFWHVALLDMQDLVERGLADEQTVKDWQALQAFVSAEEGDVAKQEKLARAGEAYLREGRAPKPELASAFRKFTKWLTDIYRTVRDLNVEINDDIRRVFDRMLATDEDIRVADYYYGRTNALLDSLALSEQERDALRQSRADAKDAAEHRRLARRLEAVRQAEKEKVAEQATSEVEESPVYKAVDRLIEAGGLNSDTVKALYGPEVVEVLKKHGKSVVKKNGTADLLDIAAEQNFDSPEALLEELRARPTKAEAIKARTEELLNAREEEILQLAEEGIPGEEDYHNEKSEDAILKEIDAIRKQLDRTVASRVRQIDRAAMKAAVQEHLNTLPLRKAKRYGRFAQAEQRAIKEALAAVEAGDYEAAIKAKRDQLMNHMLVAEAVKLREELAAIGRRMSRTAKSKPGNIRQDYHDLILDLLRVFGFERDSYQVVANGRIVGNYSDPKTAQARADELNGRVQIKTAGPRSPANMKQIGDIVSEAENGPVPLELPIAGWIREYQRGQEPTDFNDLTPNQVRELDEAVKIIAARGRNTLDTLGAILGYEGLTLEDAVEATKAPLEGRKTKDRPAEHKPFVKAIYDIVQGILAEQLHAQYAFKIADGSLEDGPFQRLFKAVAAKQDMAKKQYYELLDGPLKEIGERLSSIHERLSQKGTYFEVDGAPVPEVMKKNGITKWTSDKIVALCLNLGNKGNLDAVEQGLGLGISEQRAIAELLTTEDWNMIQGIWDLIETLYPALDETYFRLHGYRMQKVQAQELTVRTADGEYLALRGGYYPLAFDSTLSREVAAFNEKDNILNETLNVFHRNGPRDSMTKQRVGGLFPPRLTLHVLYKHIKDTLNMTHMAEVLTEVHRVLKDKELAALYTDVLGRENYEALTPWLSKIARPEAIPNGKLDALLTKVQSLTSIAALGLNPATGLKQVLSLTSAAQRLGWGETLTGLRQMITGKPWAKIEEIDRISAFMRDRAKNVEVEIGKLLNQLDPMQRKIKLAGRTLTLKDVQDFALINIRIGDAFGAYPTWIAAYNKAMKTEADHEKAVAFADKLVSETQPVTSALYRNLWQMGGARGGTGDRIIRWGIAPFTGWTMKFGSILRANFALWQEGKIDSKTYAAHVANEMILPVVGAALIGTLTSKADDEEWGDYAWDALGYWASWVPFLNQIPRAMRYGPMNLAENPALTGLKKAGIAAWDTKQLVVGKKDAKDLLRSYAELGAFITGIPVTKAYKELKDVLLEDEEK